MGPDGLARTVQAGSVIVGNTKNDAPRPAVLMGIKAGHAPGRGANSKGRNKINGRYACKYEGCISTFSMRAGRLTHEKKTKLHTIAPTIKPATYKIQSKNDGKDSWTCNGDHILVVKWNIQPTAVLEWPARDDAARSKPFYFAAYTKVDRPGLGETVVKKTFNYKTADEAVEARELFMTTWTPLVWEGPVWSFMLLSATLRAEATMFQPDAVQFNADGSHTLSQVMYSVLGTVPSAAQVELTAWALGMWLTDGFAGRPIISQIKESNTPNAAGEDVSHTAVVERLKTWRVHVAGEAAGEDDVPPALDDGGFDVDDAVERALEGDEDVTMSQAVAAAEEMEDAAAAEEVGRGMVGFDQYSSAGNAVYKVNMGSKFGRILKEYGLINDKRFPHRLLTEKKKVRMALLAGVIDGDGYASQASKCYEVAAKKRSFIDGLIHLARGLGFSTGKVGKKECENEETGKKYIGWRVNISGSELFEVMTTLNYKRFAASGKPAWDQRADGFTVTKVEHRKYCGFTLDGDGRCLLGDFTVTHNVSTARNNRRRAEAYGIRMLTCRACCFVFVDFHHHAIHVRRSHC